MTKLPFKVIAADMDGTFMRDDQTFDKNRFSRILDQLRNQKAHFIVSSGRPYSRLKKDFAGFLEKIDLIADNGSLLIQDNKIISKTLISYQTTIDIINFINQHYPESSVIATGVDCSYTTVDASPEFKKTMDFYYPDRLEVNNLLKAVKPNDQITKFTLSYKTDFSKDLETAFNKNHDEKIHCTSSGFGLLDIVPYSVNKGNALKHFLDYFNATPSELIAFGDGMNDEEMIKLAGFSYAMENGEPALKKLAKNIAPSNNDDGVLEVLDEFLN